MTLRSMADRAREIVAQTLRSADPPEVEGLLVAGALVSRDGDHYRIEHGAETAEELEHLAERSSGRCDCGGLLSSRGARTRCRSCNREFEVC